MSNNVKEIASLSTANLGYSAKSLRKLTEDKGAEKNFLYRVAGVVDSIITGEGKHGSWVGFKGQFVAVMPNGDVFKSNAAFLPATIAKGVEERLSHGEVDIEFKGDVFAVETDKNASGYAFLCDPVITAVARDKFDKLTAAISGEPMPALISAPAEVKQISVKKKSV